MYCHQIFHNTFCCLFVLNYYYYFFPKSRVFALGNVASKKSEAVWIALSYLGFGTLLTSSESSFLCLPSHSQQWSIWSLWPLRVFPESFWAHNNKYHSMTLLLQILQWDHDFNRVIMNPRPIAQHKHHNSLNSVLPQQRRPTKSSRKAQKTSIWDLPEPPQYHLWLALCSATLRNKDGLALM